MKKILVVLLILAVAGGVFAQQGEWSLGGSAELGTRLNFDPQPEIDGEDDPATADGIAFNRWDAMRGALSVGYTRGEAFVGLDINTLSQTDLTVSFNGDAFRGKFVWSDLLSIITGAETPAAKQPFTSPGGSSVKRLWGEFKFFDGMITLLPAFKSDASEYWVSDVTGAFLQDGKGSYLDGWYEGDIFANNVTFTYNDEWYGDYSNNYLLAKAEVGGLSFGLMIPRLFKFSGFWGWGTPTGTEFIRQSVKQSIIGLSFEQSPFEFAAQFEIEHYGVYFGGKFFAGPITVGLSFQGILDGDGQKTSDDPADTDPQQLKIGGRVDYEGSGFGGGLKGFYEKEDEGMETGAPSDWYLTTIGVEPFFFYDAIPSHLRFSLDVGFYFFNLTNGSDSTKVNVWAVQPQIFWNFLGTGAGTYWSYNTGIMIRYRMASADVRDIMGPGENNSVNFLDVVFKWGF